MKRYITICQHVITNGKFGGVEICYTSDLETFKTIKEAISHGFTLERSDDFNIGVLIGKKLKQLLWMDKPLKYSYGELNRIQKDIGV